LLEQGQGGPHPQDLPHTRKDRISIEQVIVFNPDTPFDWMDRPPSFLRLLVAKWLAGMLYPKTFP